MVARGQFGYHAAVGDMHVDLRMQGVREQAAQTTRDNILKAATKVFARYGYEGGSVEKISKAAKSFDRMIYYYFGSKEGLFIEVLEETYRRMNDAESKLDLDTARPVEALQAVIRFVVGYYRKNPEFITLLNTENLHKGKHISKSMRAREYSSPAIEVIRCVLESGQAQGSAVIKSHHNVGGLPEKLGLKLLEPLRELFKDEVRKIGLELGLPYDMLYRHPFPGPGLGVRVLGEVKKEYCDLLRKADAVFIEELRKADLYNQVSQAFAVFLPVRSVGVMGDGRKYDWVIALRAVETIDFMTAHWAHLPYDFLGHVSNRIINEINGISRVVYDVSGKPPATIEWE